MRHIFSIVLCLTVVNFYSPVHAAFPAQHHAAINGHVSYNEFINTAIEKYIHPSPSFKDKLKEGSPTPSIIAFISALIGGAALAGGFIALGGTAVASAPIWFGAALAASTIAIIFGAKGFFTKPLSALGRIGLGVGVAVAGTAIVTMFLWLLEAIFLGGL